MVSRHGGDAVKSGIAGVRRAMVPLMIFSIVINLLTLVMPIYMLQIYDRVLTSRNLTTLLLLTVVAFAFLAVGSLLVHYRSRMAARLGTRLSQQLEQTTFSLMVAHRLGNMKVERPFIQDLDSIRDFIGGGGMTRLFDIPWTPLFLLVIYLLHPLAGGVAAGFVAALLLIDWLTFRKASGQQQLYQKARLKADQFLESGLLKAETIWAMGMADSVGARWHKKQVRALAEQSKSSDAKSGHDALRRFVQQGAQMAMLGIGAFLAVKEEITAGTIVAGSIICARALSPVNGITRSWRQYGDVRHALAVLKEAALQSESQSHQQVFASQDMKLQINGMTPHFGEGVHPVIRGLNFSLEPGMGLAVVGPNGTGKSTFAKTLIGARRPMEGIVTISGVDIHSMPAERLGRIVGYVPEGLSLIDGTFGENIARFGAARIEDLDLAVERVGLGASVALLPEGYDTPITVAANLLSPINLRFVALARALYGDPTVLVLDQIDEGMDPESLQILSHVIRTSQSLGQMVVLVTNRASIVRQLDRVMVLSKRGVETFCDVNQLPSIAKIS